MAARRCSIDGVNYPTNGEFYTCPICGEKTDFVSNAEPDEDYPLKVAWAQERAEQATLEPPLIPTTSEPIPVKPAGGDFYWLHRWDLWHAGVRDRLHHQDLIQVGKRAFEVVTYVHDRRSYLTRPFALELSAEDLRRLAGE